MVGRIPVGRDAIELLVRKQMEPLRGARVTPQLLDSVERSFPYLYRDHFVRYRIADGRLAYRAEVDKYPDYIRERFAIMTTLFETLAPSLPDTVFELYLGDGFAGWMKDCPAPVFAFSRHRLFDFRALLLPDPLTLSQSDSLRKQVAEGNATHPWHRKIERAFWRGSTTGDWLSLDQHHRNLRFRLVKISIERPDCIDAGFTGFHPTCGVELQDVAKRSGWMRPRVTIQDHMRFKYLVLVDGFTSPWQRDFWSLQANSVVLKQRSDVCSWFHDLIVEHTHYIPVAADLSDICEVVEYARHNDGQARRIMNNANAFAASHLSDAQMAQYVLELIRHYSQLQDQ